CGKEYAIRNGIPRFVNSDDYVSNFSLEWNRFAKTQLDSLNKTKISADRFKEVSGLDPEWLKGKTVLEAGCGMGRFLEVVAETGSQVVGIDLSFSVDAARNNLKRFANIHLIQADLFNPPLLKKRFDLIYSIGVLHHTPNPKEAFLRISHLLRKNGEIAIWISPKSRFPFFPKATNLARIFTPKMKPQVLLNLVEKFVPLVLPLIRIPFIGQYLKGWVIPLCDYEGQLPLSKEELVEWSILDTFDLLSPKYLYPYSEEEIRQWCLEAGLSDIYTLSPPVILRAKRY
ncbi:MAG: class I SAM-dependent methyltransferase, partial [Candidatus Omnitrophica bacterium]|nr:class I SAM-dependent methyltransferase [Candidatus Omnitrophota bacterium]